MKALTKFFAMALLGGTLLWVVAPRAMALGFRNPDQGARATGQGEAYVAQADDASAIYYNPAGLTQLEGTHITSGGFVSFPNIRFRNGASNISEEMNTFSFLPHLYVASDLGQKQWRFGLGVNIPFGNQVEYSNSGPFQFIVTESSLSVINFAPTVACKLNDQFSFGVGLNVYYGETELKRNVDFSGFGLPSGQFHFEGDGQTVGATVGLLYRINNQHSVGAVYRSPFAIDFEDSAVLKHPILGTTGPATSRARIDFPQSVAVGYAYRATEKLKMEVDVEWTNWDTLNVVRLNSAEPTFDGIPLPFNWKDSFYYEFGAQYQFNEHWVARAGYIFSENTVPDSAFSPTLPDSDRHVFSAGVGYSAGRVSLDLVYQYSLSEDRTVKNSGDLDGDTIPGDTNGKWKSDGHAVMFSGSMKF